MSQFFNNVLEPLSYFIYALALLLRYDVDKQSKVKALVVYYTIATALMIYASWVINLPDEDPRRNNNWLYNLLFLLPNLLLFYFFYHTFSSGRKRLVVKGLALLNVLIFSINDFILGHFNLFNSFCNSLFYVSIVVCVLMYFHQVLTNVSEKNILVEFDFWLTAGYLLYFLGSFFIVVTYDYLSSKLPAHPTNEQLTRLGTIWGISNILLFLSASITLIGNVWTRQRGRLR